MCLAKEIAHWLPHKNIVNLLSADVNLFLKMVSSGAQLCYRWSEEDLADAVISDKVVVARLLANLYH